jgi:hypothetical protein
VLSRQRLISLLAAAVSVLFITQYLRVWASLPDEQARTSDFAGSYAAATLWREGHASRMYDAHAQQAVLAAAGTPRSHLDIPYENPPLAAIVASPLTLLGASAAYRVFSALQLLVLLAAVIIAMHNVRWGRADRTTRVAIGAVALAGIGSGLLLIEGQWDGVCALAVAAAFMLWRRQSSLAAGVVIGLLFALSKPHLAIGLIAFAAGKRDARALLGILLGGVATVAATVVFAGPAALSAFVHALLTPSYNPLPVMQGASGFFASWLGSGATSLVLTTLVCAAGAVTAGWLGRQASERPRMFEPAFAGACVLTLFIAPHLLGHDLVLLAPAFIALVAWLARHTPATISLNGSAIAVLAWWVLLSFASQQDLGNYASAPPGRITPVLLAIGAAGCVWIVSGARSGRDVVSSERSLILSARH